MDDVVIVLYDTEQIPVHDGSTDSEGDESDGRLLSTLLDVNVTRSKQVGMTGGSSGEPMNLPSNIKAVGPTGWGIVLSLHKGVEWQLGIVHEGKEVELTAM